jgi:pentatricopeptide repeat protein
MDEYVESGRTEDLDHLRHEMMRNSARPDLWVAAQMKFYLDKRQYIVVLRQFMQYYACVGVPREQVLPYTQEGSLWLRGKADHTHPSLPIVSSPTDSRGVSRWPSTHILTMVWQSLVSLSEDLQSLRALYHSFLDYWDRHRPSTSLERPSISSENPLPSIRFQYPPVMRPDTVHFHMFIVAFARLAGPEAAMQVLVDMQARDIRPDAHNWTTLAGHYAGQDDTGSAERILRRMETTLTDDQVAPASSSARTDKTRTLAGPVSRPAGWIPGPNLVTYTTILRGLVDRGRIEEARQFEGRMKAAGYVPGSDERTDMVLDLLRQREGSARVSWQERVHWQPGYVPRLNTCRSFDDLLLQRSSMISGPPTWPGLPPWSTGLS